MRSGPRSSVAARATVLALTLAAAGCSHLSAPRWPWQRASAPAPGPVQAHVFDISGPGAVSFPQYWKRNTLVVDLSSASGSGSITLRPSAGNWPIRLAFRVTPGAIGQLEVHADERTTLPITPSGGKPIDLEIALGVYTAYSAEMTVTWGPTTAAYQSTPTR